MNNEPMILVTGATGFLGGRIVERLILERRARVRVLVRSFRGVSKIATLPVEYRRGDVTDIAAVMDAALGCDLVIHCASHIEPGVAPKLTSTCEGTRITAMACAKANARLVHISSCAVYGIPDAPLVDETAPHRPRHRKDTYGLAKIAAEADLRAFCRKHGLKAAILQPTMIFGPHSHEWTLMPLAMLQRSNIAMPDDDHSICNVVYVDDVVSAAFLAADVCDATCEAYLINGKDLLTWSEYLSRHTDMGALGKVVKVPRERLDRLRADAAQSRSLLRMLVSLLRDEPKIRATILSTRMAGIAYSLLQKWVSQGSMAAIRAKLTDREEGAPAIKFRQERDLPLRLPPPHFLDLAGQTYRFSSAKATRLLGYAPRHSVDTALSMLRAWAEWSRLVGLKDKHPVKIAEF